MGAESQAPPNAWRFRVGVFLFVAGFVSPLLIPVVAASGLPAAWKAGLSGLLAVGIPEIGMLAAVAVLGKSGFNALKHRFLELFKKHGPAETVSRTRYRVGLVMFALPPLLGWLTPYIGHLIPGYAANPALFGALGDATFVTSFFVLGGEFWDKVRALFVHGARAVFPS